MNTPSVYEYNNFRKFLHDWYEAERSRDRNVTKSDVSRRLGLPNTRSYFTDVLGGKLVTELFQDRFAVLLGLDPEESRFFRTLVRFNQATLPDERELAFDQLVALNRTPKRILDPREYLYYRHWWYGAIRALLAIEDHAEDFSAIACRLVPSVTARQVREAVEVLEELGMIGRNSQGFWKPVDASITTGDGCRDEMVVQLQLQQLDLARHAAMTRFDSPKEIATNTLHLSEGALAKVRERLMRFRSEVRAIAHKDDAPATCVYNLCLALFPLTTKVKP
ncbi:MAG: hypothetical protein RL318_2174 [Fibrobacterota bacterium]|jgi:uncharacterized protein (TIGR02147 family)